MCERLDLRVTQASHVALIVIAGAENLVLLHARPFETCHENTLEEILVSLEPHCPLGQPTDTVQFDHQVWRISEGIGNLRTKTVLEDSARLSGVVTRVRIDQSQ